MANENIQSAVKKNGFVIINVQGKLDAGTAPKFNEYMKSILGKGETKIILDLGNVQYMASSGLGVLIASQQIANQQKGEVYLCNVPASIQKVLSLLGYSDAFTMADSVEALLKEVSNG